MTGETPDDKQYRRDEEDRRVGAVLAAALGAFAPPKTELAMPKEPSSQPKMETSRGMSENGNGGQYLAVRAEVEGVKAQVESIRGDYHDLKADISARFSSMSDEVRGISRSISDLAGNLGQRGSDNVKTIGLFAASAIGITLTILTAFGGLAKSNLDTNIQFTNEKIATQASIVKDDFATTNASIRDVAAAVTSLQDTTIPRPELEYRINSNRDAIATVQKTVAENVVPRTEFERRIENIRDDIEALKDNTLKRADIDGRFGDFQKRIDLISNRVELLQQTVAGTAVLQEQVKETQSQIAELRRILLPAPK